MGRRHGRVRECTRRLALAHRRVDPAAVEEALGDHRHLRRKAAIGIEHDPFRVRPGNDPLGLVWQRRVAIPVRELVLAEPPGLHRIVAMRRARIGLPHRADQRFHHLALDPVGEMAAVGHVLEAAPAVGDFLVLGERVGDQREEANVVLEHLGQSLGRGPALASIRVHEEMERRLQRGRLRLAVDLEAQRRHGLAEQAAPGPAPRHRFLAEQALEPLIELVGLFLAQVVEPRLVDGQRRRPHRRGEIGFGDLVELQLEEHQVGGDGGQLLLHVAVELGLGRIGGVGGVQQAGIRAEPAHHVAQRLVGLDGLGQGRPILAERDELALVAVGNALCVRRRRTPDHARNSSDVGLG